MASGHFTSVERQRGPGTAVVPVAVSNPEDREDPRNPVLGGESVAVRRLRSQVRRIAPYFRVALIHGEAGSGKQLVARAIHALSPGTDGPFIAADASVLAASFSDGTVGSASATSVVESACGGTLYLSGVGELSYRNQAAILALLRAGNEHRANPAWVSRTRFGGFEARRADTRILASSDRDLRTLAAIGQFRQDLFALLSSVEIHVAPLRQRLEDITALAEMLLERMAAASGQFPKLLAEATVVQLQERLWPGNLRELERVIGRAAALAEGGMIEPRHLLSLVEPANTNSAAPTEAKSDRLHDVVHRHVFDVLTRCGGNKLRAAEVLGISRSTLYRMIDAEAASPNTPLP